MFGPAMQWNLCKRWRSENDWMLLSRKYWRTNNACLFLYGAETAKNIL